MLAGGGGVERGAVRGERRERRSEEEESEEATFRIQRIPWTLSVGSNPGPGPLGLCPLRTLLSFPAVARVKPRGQADARCRKETPSAL